MKDIICEKCGRKVEEHYWGGVMDGECDQDEHEVYRAHIAKQDAVIEEAKVIIEAVAVRGKTPDLKAAADWWSKYGDK